MTDNSINQRNNTSFMCAKNSSQETVPSPLTSADLKSITQILLIVFLKSSDFIVSKLPIQLK
jgi:hypothetical protein